MHAYCLTNTVNGKKYIGITRALSKRWRWHRSFAASGKGWALHAAIRKHGAGAFATTVLATADSWEELCALEIALIAKHRTFIGDGRGYNMTRGGDGMLGRVRSVESREKIRQILKGRIKPREQVERLAAMLRGRTLTDGHKAKMSAALKGRKHTPEARERMSQKRRGRPMSEQQRQALIGHAVSEDTRRAVAEANRRRVWTQEMRDKSSATSTGRKRSAAAVEKMLATNRAAPADARAQRAAKQSVAMKGRKFTDEHRRRLSEAQRARYARLQADGKTGPS